MFFYKIFLLNDEKFFNKNIDIFLLNYTLLHICLLKKKNNV